MAVRIWKQIEWIERKTKWNKKKKNSIDGAIVLIGLMKAMIYFSIEEMIWSSYRKCAHAEIHTRHHHHQQTENDEASLGSFFPHFSSACDDSSSYQHYIVVTYLFINISVSYIAADSG